MQCTRNRHYDPKTGRFTQEDANGIAGGLNLYGFADGDPITYSDPFGLCPWPPSSCLQDLANWGAQRGGAIGSLALNAGAAGAALFEVSSGADIENAVEALGEGRYLAAGASAFFATPGGKGAKLLKNAAGEIAERIGKHSVSIRLPNGIKRVDLKGRSHGGVETPHVQEYRYHRNPVNGRVNSSKLPVRPATWQDLREVERVLQDRN